MLESLLSFLSPSVVILIGAIVVAFCSAMNIKDKWLKYFALAGTLIVALGTFWQAQNQNNENTGGNSYAYLVPQTYLYTSSNEPPSYNDVKLHLEHVGKYPLHDIQIQLVDVQKSHQLLKERSTRIITDEEFTAATRTFQRIDRLDPQRITEVFKLDLPANVDRQDFSIFFDARNGKWVQQLRFVRSKNKHWGSISRTTRKGEVLREQGTETLPKDDAGKPKWD